MKTLKLLMASLAGLVAMTGFNVAEAALPAGVQAGFTTLQTDGLALIDLAWPVIIAITVAFIIIKLFKRSAGSVG